MKTVLKYCGVTLLEGHNTFELKPGVRPSFGTFRCSSDAYDSITEGGGVISGNLQFGADDDDDKVVLQSLYLVKATLNSLTKVYTLILADPRILWQNSYGTKDYNTYATRGISADSANEYTLFNLNSGSEWTYSDVFTDIGLGVSLTNTRKLRNVRGLGISNADILERLLYDSCGYVVWDLIANSATAYKLGAYTAGTDYSAFIIHDNQIFPGAINIPANIKAYYAAHQDGAWKYHNEVVSGGAGGDRLFYTQYTDSVDGLAANTSFATELAGCYANSTSNWFDYTLKGIQPVAASNAAHIITWTMGSGPEGSTTRVQRYFPIIELPQYRSNLATYEGSYVPQATVVVLCSQDGGAAGSDGVACTYTYTITDKNTGVQLATGVTLKCGRLLAVQMTAGTEGLAHYDHGDAVWYLYQINEVAYQNDCGDS